MPPLHHISLSPFSSSYLVLHTPLPSNNLIPPIRTTFSTLLCTWSGLVLSIHLSSPVHRYFLRSSSVCLNTTTPLLIFSSTLPPPIPFSILPCARPLNRNESRVQHFIPVPGYLVGNTAPLSSFSQIFLSITIASHGIYFSPYTIFERTVFFSYPLSSSLGLSKSLQ